jgi:hypothetical protein
VDLGRVDAWETLRDGQRVLSRFYAATGELLDLSESADPARTVDRSALVIRRAEMDRFEDEAGVLVNNQPEPSADRRRGAPPKYDWEGFWVELMRHVWEEGCPKTQSELLQVMRGWFEMQLGP